MTQANKIYDYSNLDYLYCSHCRKIKEYKDLDINGDKIMCLQCGNNKLAEPGWVACPYNKMTAVKCPMGGKGIITTGKGLECLDRCFFRASFD